jgi:hypothetical protein
MKRGEQGAKQETAKKLKWTRKEERESRKYNSPGSVED